MLPYYLSRAHTIGHLGLNPKSVQRSVLASTGRHIFLFMQHRENCLFRLHFCLFLFHLTCSLKFKNWLNQLSHVKQKEKKKTKTKTDEQLRQEMVIKIREIRPKKWGYCINFSFSGSHIPYVLQLLDKPTALACYIITYNTWNTC